MIPYYLYLKNSSIFISYKFANLFAPQQYVIFIIDKMYLTILYVTNLNECYHKDIKNVNIWFQKRIYDCKYYFNFISIYTSI